MLVIWKSKHKAKEILTTPRTKPTLHIKEKKPPKKPRETKNRTTNMELNVWLRNYLLSEWKEIKD